MGRIEDLAVSSIKTLSVDMIQKANSGHPGLPLGAASMAYSVWANHLCHSPNYVSWLNRDRFILSAGHGSAMLYSLLHLFGYPLSVEDLKNFRQWDSKTPGHPEFGHTVGVETTTGPLGAGVGAAVGMAISQEHLASVFNRENYPLFDHHTYVLVGDGCLMEGISSEALSLAGTLQLKNLIVIYDSNNITIEGRTDISFTEDVCARMRSFGFQTIVVDKGQDVETITEAIKQAKEDTTRPSFIEVRTKIGYMSNKEDSPSAHGEPLGEENIRALKEKMNYPSQEPFFVEEEVYTHFKKIIEENEKKIVKWNEMFEQYKVAYPKEYKQLQQYYAEPDMQYLLQDAKFLEKPAKPQATRASSGDVLQFFKDVFSNLIGGSADLGPSNKSVMNDAGYFSVENRSGRNIHFGVRELAMSGIVGGMKAYGGLKPYCATFFVFSDYMKPMMRLAALMNLPVTYVLTHDSIGVGEDGPTHQPIEQLPQLRALHNLDVFRPADAFETKMAWYHALTSQKTPTAILLTRQNLPQLETSSTDALRGGYIVYEPKKVEKIIIATGSEVSLAIEAAKEMDNVRVISMPCVELFKRQSKDYQESILPTNIRKRMVIEAASSFGWHEFVGLDGKTLCIDHFGASAPGEVLFEKFNFTKEYVLECLKTL